MPWNRRMFWNVRATRALRAISWSGMRSSRKSSPFARRRVPAARVASTASTSSVRHDAVAGERQAPFGRLVEAGDAVEDRRLAGAVRADQRGDVAAPDGEGEGVDGDEAAEPHGEIFDGRAGGWSASSSAVSLLDEIAGHGFSLLEEDRRRARRDEAARLPDHHDHHRRAEQQHAVLGRIEVLAEDLPSSSRVRA